MSEVIGKVQNSVSSDLYIVEADNIFKGTYNPSMLIEHFLDRELIKPDFIPILYPTAKYVYTTKIPFPGSR